MAQPREQQMEGEDNSQRFALALPILLADPARWGLQSTLPCSLESLCIGDGDDQSRGVMWVGGGDCFPGDEVYRALLRLQKQAGGHLLLSGHARLRHQGGAQGRRGRRKAVAGGDGGAGGASGRDGDAVRASDGHRGFARARHLSGTRDVSLRIS